LKRIALVTLPVLFVSAVLALPGANDASRDYLIRVGPRAYNLSETQPARLSIAKQNTIRWWADNQPLRIIFRIDEFPTLADGTRITTRPLKDMDPALSNQSWLAGGTSRANPELQPLLERADGKELIFRYQIALGSSWGTGTLIIQQ